MAKTDWTLTDTVKPDDFNNIGREINQLRTDVDHIEVPAGSLTEAGIVQLSNSTNSASETMAATPKAVKTIAEAAATAQTKADQAFQLGNERKSEVVAALVALGISASASETWDSLLPKLTSIPNRGAGGTVTPGTTNQSKAAGYYSSPITVQGDADLVAANIRSGVDIFGTVGSLVEGKRVFYATYSGTQSGIHVDVGFPWQVIFVQASYGDGAYRFGWRNPLTGAYDITGGGSYSAGIGGFTDTGFIIHNIYSQGGIYHVYAYGR